MTRIKICIEYEIQIVEDGVIPSHMVDLEDNIKQKCLYQLDYGGNQFWRMDRGSLKVKAKLL